MKCGLQLEGHKEVWEHKPIFRKKEGRKTPGKKKSPRGGERNRRHAQRHLQEGSKLLEWATPKERLRLPGGTDEEGIKEIRTQKPMILDLKKRE